MAASRGSRARGSFGRVSPSLTVADCPECRGISTVIFGTCGACFAEFFEDDDDLQPWRDQAPSPEPPTLPTESALIPATAELFLEEQPPVADD
jgi:hypothetical protein